MTTEKDYIGFIGDLSQAGFHKLGKITPEVDSLVEHLRDALDDVGPNGKVIHIAHSQGAIITALATKRLTPEEQSQIEVLTFGGGVALTRSQYPFLSRIVNYYSINDPLLLIVPAASKALKTGFVFSKSTGEQEFVFLTPRIGDPALDHCLTGDTYLEALTWEGMRYQNAYQNVAIRIMRPLILGLATKVIAILLVLRRVVFLFAQKHFMPLTGFVFNFFTTLLRILQDVVEPLRSVILGLMQYLLSIYLSITKQDKFEQV
eukprot:CAMPEP_0116050954 /NCGR_PEP_ID=MMETSP0322-20121206/689_1 /TAXON_ID=163516 /ORGANISM="Leptocylindrus danicus var. apora, Strain B651" /LENGTH=260 /DNA_ID=CAMNT_0003533605 /DNA_START=249 /DNA_END=1027 /DNA_ORIENTATION=+